MIEYIMPIVQGIILLTVIVLTICVLYISRRRVPMAREVPQVPQVPETPSN
jgi:hypothetical protein